MTRISKIELAREYASQLSERIDAEFKSFKEKSVASGRVANRREWVDLYFNLARFMYEQFRSGELSVNLSGIKRLLEKSVQTDRFQPVEAMNVRQAKFMLEASCDVYFDLDETSYIGHIRGNAVVLRSVRGVKNEFDCFYIKDGKWLRPDAIPRLSRVNTAGLTCNRNTRILIRSEQNTRQIDLIALRAQHKRGQASVRSIYYSLKRKCKRCKREIIKVVRSIRPGEGWRSTEASINSFVAANIAGNPNINKYTIFLNSN